MNDDPEPIGQALSERVESLRELAATRPPDPPPPPMPPAFVEARRHAEQSYRDSAWTDVIPSRFLWARVEQFTGVQATGLAGRVDVAAELTAWANAPGGRNLVLTGPTGTGKTHAAVAAARAAFELGADVRFVPVVELLDDLRPGGPADFIDDLFGIDRLVLDDLGAERPSDWTLERLYAVVNRRWMEELPTVATTNLDPPGLLTALGERIYSRLVGSGAVVLQLAGQDRRRTSG